MEEQKIRDFHTRFRDKMPLKDEADIEYMKSKLYKLVETFVDEFFMIFIKIPPNNVLDASFFLLARVIDDLDLNDVDDFLSRLGCSILAVVNRMGGTLKVSHGFFVEQFKTCFEMRALSFTIYSSEHSEYFLNCLKSSGISHDVSVYMLECAIEWAEEKMRGSLLAKEVLLPLKFKQPLK
jgi:hypothetical protein